MKLPATDMSVYDQNQVIMSLNQILSIQSGATGSNNAKRWLMVPGKYNQIASVTNSEMDSLCLLIL